MADILAAGHRSSFFFMGHTHEFKEQTVPRKERPEEGQVGQQKVIATVMPVGGAGGVPSEVKEVRQGMLLYAAPKVKDWKKQLAVSEGKGKDVTLKLEDRSCGMYESLTPQAAAPLPPKPPSP
jgi:hypothetical protein